MQYKLIHFLDIIHSISAMNYHIEESNLLLRSSGLFIPRHGFESMELLIDALNYEKNKVPTLGLSQGISEILLLHITLLSGYRKNIDWFHNVIRIQLSHVFLEYRSLSGLPQLLILLDRGMKCELVSFNSSKFHRESGHASVDNIQSLLSNNFISRSIHNSLPSLIDVLEQLLPFTNSLWKQQDNFTWMNLSLSENNQVLLAMRLIPIHVQRVYPTRSMQLQLRFGISFKDNSSLSQNVVPVMDASYPFVLDSIDKLCIEPLFPLISFQRNPSFLSSNVIDDTESISFSPEKISFEKVYRLNCEMLEDNDIISQIVINSSSMICLSHHKELITVPMIPQIEQYCLKKYEAICLVYPRSSVGIIPSDDSSHIYHTNGYYHGHRNEKIHYNMFLAIDPFLYLQNDEIEISSRSISNGIESICKYNTFIQAFHGLYFQITGPTRLLYTMFTCITIHIDITEQKIMSRSIDNQQYELVWLEETPNNHEIKILSSSLDDIKVICLDSIVAFRPGESISISFSIFCPFRSENYPIDIFLDKWMIKSRSLSSKYITFPLGTIWAITLHS